MTHNKAIKRDVQHSVAFVLSLRSFITQKQLRIGRPLWRR